MGFFSPGGGLDQVGGFMGRMGKMGAGLSASMPAARPPQFGQPGQPDGAPGGDPSGGPGDLPNLRDLIASLRGGGVVKPANGPIKQPQRMPVTTATEDFLNSGMTGGGYPNSGLNAVQR